jgi:predicted ATPase
VPVVIGAMAPGYNLLAVEQPELHVHPAIQCSLADVLALQVIDKDRQLLLETHSEHLMLRLLRRVRETTEGELPVDAPKLTPDDLSVLYVASDAEGMMITPLPVTEDGDFSRPWPKGFFSERRGELF